MEVTTSEQSWSAILYMFGTYSKSFHDIYFKAILHVGWCLPFLDTLQGFLLQRFSGCYTSLHLSLLGMTPPGFGLFLPSWCCQHSCIHVTTPHISHVCHFTFWLAAQSVFSPFFVSDCVPACDTMYFGYLRNFGILFKFYRKAVWEEIHILLGLCQEGHLV